MTAPDTLPPELAELGELLREDPPRPSPCWAARLDDRAAAGFPPPPRRSRRSRLQPLRRALLPAMGFACVVALVVGLATLPPEGEDESGGSGSGGGASTAVQSEGDTSSGSSRDDSTGSEEPVDPAPGLAPPVPPGPGGGSPGSDSRDARKQERSAALTLAAPPREIEAVGDAIVRVTDAVGGFVVSSSVAGGSDAGGTFELRVPTARLPKALADLSRLAHVRERTQASRDITARSVSARERVREARLEREGLLRALARATTLNETESIRARLRTVNRALEAARASVRRVDNRAAFANVSVALVADRGSAGAAGEGGRWTPADALDDALRVLEVAAGIALIVLSIVLPLAILAGLARAAARLGGRRRRERTLDAA